MGQAPSEALGTQADKNPGFCEAYIQWELLGLGHWRKPKLQLKADWEMVSKNWEMQLGVCLWPVSWWKNETVYLFPTVTNQSKHFSFTMSQGDKPTKEWSP